MTLLEILITLSVLGIALLVMGLRTDPDQMLLQRAANELQVFLQRARLEAIKQNRPVVVHFRDGQIESCLGAGCPSASAGVHRWETSTYRDLTYQENFPTDLLWTPEGFPAQTGTGFASGTIVLRKKHRTIKVILASGGRVRQEVVQP